MRLFGIFCLVICLTAAGANGQVPGEVLTYQATNKWVAPGDNAPLVRMVAKAKAGTSVFNVRCPRESRALCKQRLDVLHQLLNNAHPEGAVLLVEVPGPPPDANRLWVAPAAR